MSHPPGTSVHLIADLASCSGLADQTFIETVLRRAAEAASVTVLDVRLHHFGQGQGVTGVALLAESHISIHTWPETKQAAVDLFVCGERADANAGLSVIVELLDAEVTMKCAVARLALGDTKLITSTG